MPAQQYDNDLKSLLSPVEMGSFVLSPSDNARSIYSGIPSTQKSKMWNFSITEDGENERVLSFLVDNRTVNFKLKEPDKVGEPIKAKRLPDTESDDFGVGGSSFKGKAQIHKSSPSKVVGTFQTGKTNMTFELSKSSEGGEDWTVFPRKHPSYNVKSFVNSILEKNLNTKNANIYDINNIANEAKNVYNSTPGIKDSSTSIWDKIKKTKIPLPDIDKITYPVTGGVNALPIAALIGAGVMGAKNVGQAIIGSESRPSLLRDLLVGAGIGAGGSALFQFLGSPDSPIFGQNDRAVMKDNIDPRKPMVFSDKFLNSDNYLDLLKKRKSASESEKLAFGSGNSAVDLIALQSILGADPTLTQGDRNVLIQQARRALQSSSGGSISIDRIRNMGLGMLAGYIMSKVVGFGAFGSIAATAIGGAIGGSISGRRGGPKYNSKGYYTY
jgi:hypothetical protein